MKKKLKIILIAMLAVIVMAFAADKIYYNLVSDYVRLDYVFKGYTQHDGYHIALPGPTGLHEYYVYVYQNDISDEIEKSQLYKTVDGEIKQQIIDALNDGEVDDFVSYSASQFKISGEGIRLMPDDISEGDYYILKYFNSAGETVYGPDFDHFHLTYYSKMYNILYDLIEIG